MLAQKACALAINGRSKRCFKALMYGLEVVGNSTIDTVWSSATSTTQ